MKSRTRTTQSRVACGLILLLMVCDTSQGQLNDHEAAIAPYSTAISGATQASDGFDEFAGDLAPVPTAFRPWWSDQLTQPLRSSSNTVPVDLEALIISALDNSAQVRVFSDLPLIRETAITEADAAFDWHGFMETRWDDLSQPVGNTLTTGGPDRFRDNTWTYRGGVRRRTTYGGRFEATQRLGFQNNNSIYFQPNDQGTTKLRLGYTQPVLRGAGRVYNTSLTVLAAIDAEIAEDEFLRQLQSHLLEVTRGYWGLYLERGALLQQRRVYERALETLQELESRRQVDAVESQIVRAQAAVTERRAALIRAANAVINAQDRIQALVNDPNLAVINQLELVPMDPPVQEFVPVDMQVSLHTALQQRPEIGQAIKQIKASCVRLNMAKNEMLPQLDLILETYLFGLQGDSDIGQAWVDQFGEGEPSYSVGMLYEVPIWRRAPRARLQRRRIENRQLHSQFQSTVETLLLEVKVAVREVSTAYDEARAKYLAMQAAEKQLEFIQARWQHLPGEDRSVNLYLEDLLAAQERLGAAEFGFLKAQTTYSLSLLNLKRATGTLLQDEGVALGRACECNLPLHILDKQRSSEPLPSGELRQPLSPQEMLPTPTVHQDQERLPAVRVARRPMASTEQR